MPTTTTATASRAYVAVLRATERRLEELMGDWLDAGRDESTTKDASKGEGR